MVIVIRRDKRSLTGLEVDGVYEWDFLLSGHLGLFHRFTQLLNLEMIESL